MVEREIPKDIKTLVVDRVRELAHATRTVLNIPPNFSFETGHFVRGNLEIECIDWHRNGDLDLDLTEYFPNREGRLIPLKTSFRIKNGEHIEQTGPRISGDLHISPDIDPAILIAELTIRLKESEDDKEIRKRLGIKASFEPEKDQLRTIYEKLLAIDPVRDIRRPEWAPDYEMVKLDQEFLLFRLEHTARDFGDMYGLYRRGILIQLPSSRIPIIPAEILLTPAIGARRGVLEVLVLPGGMGPVEDKTHIARRTIEDDPNILPVLENLRLQAYFPNGLYERRLRGDFRRALDRALDQEEEFYRIDGGIEKLSLPFNPYGELSRITGRFIIPSEG